MAEGAYGGGRGILRRRTALDRFAIERRAPSPDLAAFADYLWILTWDLRDREPHRQQVLTRPVVNLTFTTGGRARVAGVVRDVFGETIAGRGRVVGVCFRPGGFRPFLGGPVSGLTDRFTPVEEIFGPSARAAADAIIAEPDRDRAAALAEDLLRSRAPDRPDPVIAEVAAIVDRIAADPALLRVDDLAAALGIGARRLQRIFAEYVGVGPKWVIRRHRMQEAAERAAAGTGVDWATLAAELGYADQSHFTRDFTRTLGISPAQYARKC
ncbi:helix-turn-helix domain-containing protein [Actinoallomurus iriomotensis]|uniref:AraC family transcriptional regulator n=1 Tax=Actinoallomurus iriomotensis TaxID=478107 RepID=A0A9W6SC89_9ACTN|nr:helix-turn-helix domain-containing protein [Actinoallomurus iriomotensis]GLY89592.1 AraC family transcriptional regulator [Actinoallomurus iriomotensis]